MSADALEILIARLLASPAETESFLAGRDSYVMNSGLSVSQVAELLKVDGVSLRFAANSLQRKRARD